MILGRVRFKEGDEIAHLVRPRYKRGRCKYLKQQIY